MITRIRFWTSDFRIKINVKIIANDHSRLNRGIFQKQQRMLPLWNKGNFVFEKLKFKYGSYAAE